MIPWDEGVLSVPDVAAPVAPVHIPRKNDEEEEEEGGEEEREEERRSNKKKAVAVYKTNWMLHRTSYQIFPEPPLVTRRLENMCLFVLV